VDPVKIFLTSSLITRQNLVVVSHILSMHVGGPKTSRDAEAPFPQDGLADPLETCQLFHHVKPYRHNCGDLSENLTPARHISRSLEWTWIDRLPRTCY